MSRLNNANEVLAECTEVGVMTDVAAGASDTLNGALAAGDGTLTLSAADTFADADKIRIGDKPFIEANVIESGGGTTSIVLQSVVSTAYASGEAVVEIEDTQIGDLTEAGARLELSGGEQAVRSGTKNGIYTFLKGGDQQQTIQFDLLNFNVENMALMAGLIESTAISGAGTAADPYVLDLRPENYGEQDARVWYWTGLREDASIIRVEAFGGKVFTPNGTLSFAQGEPTTMPVMVRALNGIRIQQY